MVLRLIRRFFFLVALLLMLAPLALWITLRLSLADVDGQLTLTGLGSAVTVVRDDAGVPTLEAASRVDLARATGFLHGQERFFQMDLMRRDAAGEISALFGGAAVAHDTRRRRHGLRAVAEAAFATMPPARQQALRAYADGVNAGLDALGTRPPEYLLLGQAPVAWTPVDTLLVVHAMWLTLTDEDGLRDLALHRVHERLPPAMARFLDRDGTHLDAALDGSVSTAPAVPGVEAFDLRTLLRDLPRPPPGLFEDGPVLGSNAFAVGRARSGGGAILANDMHLTLRVPNIWYRARLRVTGEDGIDLVGVTLPGTPAMVVGSNGALAWGFTNAYVDVTDRVRVEPVADDPSRYRTGDGDRSFVVRVETIEVAGGPPVERRYRDTVWGPVIESDGELHAVRWAAHAPEATNVELMRFERVGSVGEALAEVRHIGIPAQNVLLADAEGNIAWTVLGRLPVTLPGVDQDRVIDGTALPAEAVAWTASDDVPVVVNPPDGVLWTANARQVGGDAFAVVRNGNYAIGARAVQIRDALLAREQHDERSLLAIALDDRALYMERWRALLVQTLERAGDRVARGAELDAVLDTWTGRAVPDDAAYRWVREFRDTVRYEILATLAVPMQLPREVVPFRGVRQDEAVVWQLLDERPLHLLHPDWADWETMLAGMVERTIERVTTRYPGPLAERTFGERNLAPVAHPVSRAVPALALLLDMPAFVSSGDAFVPKVLRGTQGSSERLVLRVGDEANGLFHMPGGQSGHLLSPWYRHGFDDWAVGRPSPLMPGEGTARLELVPGD